MKKYRLTLFFVVTSVVVIVVAAIIVNRIIGELAEDNLVRIAEENTARDALHIQSMMRGQNSTPGLPSEQDVQQPMPLTLESLAGPEGLLPSNFPMLVEGLNIVKFNLFDLNGRTVWSSDPETLGISKRESPLYQKALTGGLSSKLAQDHELTDVSGVRHRLDVVETYVPLRQTPSGEIIGVMEIYRDVASDVALQVDEAKSAVLWTTVATMGGLFFVLCGFIVVADVTIHRSRRREIALIEDQLAERKRVEDALAQQAEELGRSNAELQQFAYVASHDLQEPLRAVVGFTQLVAERYHGKLDADADTFMRRTVDAASRMQDLITSLLTYSRVGREDGGFQPTDCEVVVDQEINNLQVAIEQSGAVVTHDSLPTVVANASQLGQLFRNLIGNAIKFHGQEPPRVHIASERNGSEWLFSIQDNGIGIDLQQQDRIFTIFQRLHTREEYPGTGIGLAICKKIVERLGGRIWVESESGKGASFKFSIPMKGENGV